VIQLAPGKNGQGTGLEELGPDLTPLLDILFILLVFFILTANTVEHALELALPDEGAEQAEPLVDPSTVHIALYARDQAWAVNGEPIGQWDRVEAAVLAAHGQRPDAEIVIAGDRRAPIERLLQVLAFLKEQGLTAAQILMEPSPEAGS
jgi:biopolymer transport protein ExbD